VPMTTNRYYGIPSGFRRLPFPHSPHISPNCTDLPCDIWTASGFCSRDANYAASCFSFGGFSLVFPGFSFGSFIYTTKSKWRLLPRRHLKRLGIQMYLIAMLSPQLVFKNSMKQWQTRDDIDPNPDPKKPPW